MRFSPDFSDNILASLSSDLHVRISKESPDCYVVKKAPISTYFYLSSKTGFYQTLAKVIETKFTSYKLERQISEETAGSYTQCTFAKSFYDVDLVLAHHESLIFAEAKQRKTTTRELAEYIKFIKSGFSLFLSSDESSEEAHKSLLADVFRFYKKWFGSASLRILRLVTRKYESKKGIGRGVEGYIPFVTWARGSLNSQLVNSLVFVDKLSQIKVC
jgi:hypothetical protein